MQNPVCPTCRHSRATINGCYCGFLHSYVEHTKQPPCSTLLKQETK